MYLTKDYLTKSIVERIEYSGIKNPSIAVLASGGVDSSVAVHLLTLAGYKPTLFYIQIGMDKDGFEDCTFEDDVTMVSLLAKKYSLEMNVVSLHDEYWENVVEYTINTVKSGLTPNPDVMCNKLIKFGCFEEKVGYKYDFIATGHYATTTIVDDEVFLSTSPDEVKDQTDFLAQINFRQIQKILFPTGHLRKNEVRLIAEQANLPSAKRKDSQGICFLGKINYNDFIKSRLGVRPGRIIEKETGKTIGTHQGFWFYTIGQRKGLGLSGGPWFVVKKDCKRNIILVSNGYDPETQYGNRVFVREMNFISRDPWTFYKKENVEECDREPIKITFKIRHTPDFTNATLKYLGRDLGFVIESEEKIQGIAAGQYAVIYDIDKKICFGSGMIVKGR